MRVLPLDHPGIADVRSPGRFLWWVARGRWQTLLGGMFFGIVWASSQAVMPFVLGRAIDEAHDADRVAVVEDGTISELGSHDELVEAGGSYAAMWESWHGRH